MWWSCPWNGWLQRVSMMQCFQRNLMWWARLNLHVYTFIGERSEPHKISMYLSMYTCINGNTHACTIIAKQQCTDIATYHRDSESWLWLKIGWSKNFLCRWMFVDSIQLSVLGSIKEWWASYIASYVHCSQKKAVSQAAAEFTGGIVTHCIIVMPGRLLWLHSYILRRTHSSHPISVMMHAIEG